MFNNFAKFELPAIKGNELWPETIQSPLIVRPSLTYVPNEHEPPRAEAFTKHFQDIVDAKSPQILNFLMTQRRNYQLGSVEFASTIRQADPLTMHYTNIQGKHEILGLSGTITPDKYAELQRQSTPEEPPVPKLSELPYPPRKRPSVQQYQDSRIGADYLIVNYRHVVHRDNDIRHHTISPYFPTLGWDLATDAPPYVFWADDNTNGKVESVYYNLRAIRRDYAVDSIKMECWEGIFAPVGIGPDTVTIELIVLTGNAPTKVEEEFVPGENSKVIKQANVFTGTVTSEWPGGPGSSWPGDYLCSIRYDILGSTWKVT